MDLQEFREQFIKDQLEISEDYGKIFSFIDFGNVNNWFKYDTQDWNNKMLAEEEKISIDLEKLKFFADIFSEKVKIYYGEDPKNLGSLRFTYAVRKIFGKRNLITKPLQKIKHYFEVDEKIDEKWIKKDGENNDYIEIRKSNFDVEISVDAIKMLEHYDTFCIFSGDADFTYLHNFLRKNKKKIIIIKAGYITTKLRESADLVVNAQNIKKEIVKIEQRPDESGLCE